MNHYYTTNYTFCHSNPSWFDYFASSNYVSTSLHIATSLTIPLSAYGAYCVIKVTPKQLKNAKWALLNFHIWTVVFDLVFNILLVPFLFYPAPAAVFFGWGNYLNLPSWAMSYTLESLIAVFASAAVGLLENRHSVLQTKWKIERKRIRYAINCFNYSISWSIVLPTFLDSFDMETAALEVLKIVPCPAKEFFDDRLFIVTNTPYLVSGMIILSTILSLQGGFYVFHTWYHLVYANGARVSAETRRMQLKFFVGSLMQIGIPITSFAPSLFYFAFNSYTRYYNQDKTCIFETDHIDSESLKLFPKNCTKICGYLLIDQNSDVSENELTTAFNNVKTVFGSLTIRGVNFTSANFLAGVETIECESPNDLVYINAYFMTEFGLNNFTSTSCSVYFYIYEAKNLNLMKMRNFYTLTPNSSLPQLSITLSGSCMHIEEVTNFVISDSLDIQTIYAPYCEYSDSHFDGEKICTIGNFSLQNFDTSCKRIIGNVMIKSGDEPYVRNLENVTWIYGELLIEGTSLANIDFFNNLEYMAHFQSKYQFIGIFDNPNLTNVTFPKLKRARSDHKFLMLFQRNNAKLFDSNFCWKMKRSLNSTEWHAPSIDGKSCEEIEEAQKSSCGIPIFMIVVILGFWYF